MADKEFDKTVKLSVGNTQSIPVTPPERTSRIESEITKTIKLTSENDKTVKLSAVSLTPPAAVPVPPTQPGTDPSLFPPLSTSKGTPRTIPISKIAILVLIIYLGAAWYFLPLWLKKRAEKFAKTGDHFNAAQQLILALYLFPPKKESFLAPLGKELRLLKDFSNAQKNLEKVLEKNPNHYEALVELGLTFKEGGYTDKAFQSFQKCVQLRPDDHPVLKWSAQLAFELKNYDAASSAYGKITESGSTDWEDWHRLGISYFELGKFPEALPALQTAWEKNKELKGVNTLLAKIHLSQENYPEALQRYKLEISLSPNDSALSETFVETSLRAATLSVSKRNLNEAIEFYKQALSLPSKHSGTIYYQLGVILARQKKKEALSYLAQAIKKDSSFKKRAKKEPAFAHYSKSLQFKKMTQ